MNVPDLKGHEGSWMVVPKNGPYSAVLEIHRSDRITAERINMAKYDVVGVIEYLAKFNENIKNVRK